MGGLISLYAFFRYSESFGFAAALSPSLWFADGALVDVVARAPRVPGGGRLYFDIGMREGQQSVALGRRLRDLLLAKGYDGGRDFRWVEDKEPFFDSVDTLHAVLGVLPPLLGSLTFRTDRMRAAAGEHYATATDLADYLVRKGLPFRQAHEVVGKAVRHALERGVGLEALPLEALRGFSPLIEADVREALTVEASLRARAVTGGTAPAAVQKALAEARALVGS